MAVYINGGLHLKTSDMKFRGCLLHTISSTSRACHCKICNNPKTKSARNLVEHEKSSNFAGNYAPRVVKDSQRDNRIL